MSLATAQGAASRQRPGLLSLGYHQTRVEVIGFFRSPMAVAFSFSLPVILLAMFGAVFDGEVADTGVPFRQYFTAGVIAAGLMSTSFVNLSFALAHERAIGSIKRAAATPMPPAVFFLGKLGLTWFSSACQLVLMLGLGAAFFGLDLPADPGRCAVFAFVFVVGTAAWALVGAAYSRLIRDPSNAAAMVMLPTIVLQIISGVFLVVSDLSRPVQVVAGVFPLRWMASLLRFVFLPDEFAASEPGGSWNVALGMAMLLVWVVVGAVSCLRWFKWSFDE